MLGLLMFMPVAVLGPIAEHLALRRELTMLKHDRDGRSLFTVVSMVLLVGVYHVVLWGVGRACSRASRRQPDPPGDGTVVGSRLIAQKFARPEYFQPRPSAVDYNAASTGGRNYGPSNPDHLKAVRERLDAIVEGGGRARPARGPVRDGHGQRRRHGSAHSAGRRGAAGARVARSRKVDASRVRELIAAHTEPPTFGFLGRARVNVLELNLALDQRSAPAAGASPSAKTDDRRAGHAPSERCDAACRSGI